MTDTIQPAAIIPDREDWQKQARDRDRLAGEVIADIERRGEIELSAIGIGHEPDYSSPHPRPAASHCASGAKITPKLT